MARVHTLREFDDVITAAYCGFTGASDYYTRSSALRVLSEIRVPAFILTAQDDPFVPFSSFSDPALTNNPYIVLNAPKHGGHCAFIAREDGEQRFWGEARIVEFFRQASEGASRREEIQKLFAK
jgi:predicted alpha/beta-fold hydrolase